MTYEELRPKTHVVLGGDATDGGIEQNAYELLKFTEFIREKKIQTYLEIGLAQGLTAGYMQDLGLDVTGITIDPYLLQREDFAVIIGDSHDPETVAKVADRRFDLVFIDGDHSYESVKQDYENYGKLGKFVAFHDIAGLRNCEGVKRFWGELQGQKLEFVAEGETRSGIGVLCQA